MTHGLPESTIKQIKAVFAKHPRIERVILYGSRAKGTQRPGSDVDLTLIAPQMTLTELLGIKAELEELSIPYTVDLSLHHRIENAALLEHIQRVGVAF